MQMYLDSESIRRVSTEEPDKQLRELIARKILDLADYSDYELDNLLNIITIEPSDAIADLGFLLGDRLPELVEYHTAWVELTYIISDDGFGWVVYVPVDHPFIETLPPQNRGTSRIYIEDDQGLEVTSSAPVLQSGSSH